MPGYEWFNGQRVTFGIGDTIASAEEKVDILKSERSMDEDLSLLSIRSVSSVVGRTRVGRNYSGRNENRRESERSGSVSGGLPAMQSREFIHPRESALCSGWSRNRPSARATKKMGREIEMWHTESYHARAVTFSGYGGK
jgi:hypothetical protein